VLRNAGGAEGNNYEPLALVPPGRLPDTNRQCSCLDGFACMKPPDQSRSAGLTAAAPGSASGGLTVSDIEAARDELVGELA
jgi:hypothetical protein